MKDRGRRTVCGLLGLILVSCFEPPIDEEVEIEFLADGGVDVRLRVAVSGDDDGNEALDRRVRELRQALLEGWDAWSPRFESIGAVRESTRWEKEEGVLTLFERSARLRDASDLGSFFRDAGVDVFYSADDDLAELAFYPGSPNRATRRQRHRVEAALDDWIGRVRTYVAVSARLYDYLDERPDRAAVCLGEVFGDFVDNSTLEALGPLYDFERQLTDDIAEAMQGVWQILLVEDGEAHSLNELSQLVYDPSPAPVTVRLPTPPIEVEGFRRLDGEALRIDRVGLWEALAGLESHWVHPDLLVLWVRHSRSEEPIDLAELAARRRRADGGLRADEIRAAVEERLSPAPVYRAAWPLVAGT